MLNSLKYTSNPGDSCCPLAMELTKELETTFGYVLDINHDDFLPEFLTATYLTPEFKFLITPEQKLVIKKFLEGLKLLCAKNFDCKL